MVEIGYVGVGLFIGDIWELVEYNWLLHLSALKFHPRLQINVIGLITLVLPVYRQDLGS